VAFHQAMRQAVDAHAGRVVPWSCNNGARRWGPTEMVFDFFIGELSVSNTKPAYLHEVLRKAEQLGKAQVTTMPLTGEPIVDDGIRPIARKAIATAYALGGLCMVPWDTYMPKGQPRYFGRPEAYAGLFGFVRGAARYLDGYEYAGAFGKDIACDLYGETPPVRLKAGRSVYAFPRAVPGDRDAAVVIHLVDWTDAPEPFSLTLLPSAFFGSRALQFRLLTPRPYEAAEHEGAEASKNYDGLVRVDALEASGAKGTTLEIPALSPWGILVVEPKEATGQL